MRNCERLDANFDIDVCKSQNMSVATILLGQLNVGRQRALQIQKESPSSHYRARSSWTTVLLLQEICAQTVIPRKTACAQHSPGWSLELHVLFRWASLLTGAKRTHQSGFTRQDR